MRKFIVGGVLLILTGAAAQAQDYGGGGYEAPPSYGYQAPPSYEAPPSYGYQPPHYSYQAPPRYGYAPPLHCHLVYTDYGPRRVCSHY